MMHARSVRMRRWSRWEYEQLVERGFFRPDERLELLDGLMLVKEPQSSAHMTAIRLVEDALRMAFGTRWDVRTQGPIALDAARRRWGYRSIQALGPDAVVSPLAAPAARVVVADLLP